MANTYTQLYIHLVFAVRGRESLINEKWEKQLYKYITGIVQTRGNKLIAINGMPDHIHILIGLNPKNSISELVREVKKSTNSYINENILTNGKFYWQEGFGAFSCGHSDFSKVATYIENQKEHHRNTSFSKEYTQFLKDAQVDFNPEYLFDEIE
jgi:putative transposase